MKIESHKPLIVDDASELAGRAAFAREFANLRRATDVLPESESFMRTVADNIPGLVGYWNTELRCQFANAACRNWFGRTAQEMQDIRLQDLLGEALYTQNETFVNGVLKGKDQSFECTLVKPGGEIGYMYTQFIAHKAAGKVKGFFVLATDLTKIKQAEERLRHAENAAMVQAGMVEQLRNHCRDLDTTLNTLLKREEAVAHDEKIALSQELERMIVPFLQLLKKDTQATRQLEVVKIIESNLQELISSYGRSAAYTTATRTLTPKEFQIASLVRQGLSSKEIALAMSLSPATISNHRKHIRKKLGFETRAGNLQSKLSSLRS
ncbi:MAG: PAS domain-containing protein [Sideroxyarcus sp.]|nr:PAS domain-containing protein [Sideroxyarcus sp.]